MRAQEENKVVRFMKSENPVFGSAFFEAFQGKPPEPTKRQASKWLMKKGKAYRQRFGK
jgi:hypothetical protein